MLFVAGTGVGSGMIKVLGRGEPTTRTVVENASRAWYLASGHLLFLRGGTLYAAPFDLHELRLTGQPWRLIEGATHDYFSRRGFRRVRIRNSRLSNGRRDS